MKRNAYLFIISLSLFVLIGPLAKAEWLGDFGGQVRAFRQNDARTLESRNPLAIRGGIRRRKYDIYLEYAQWKNAAGNGYIDVTETHQDLLMWFRKILIPDWKGLPYMAIGVGATRGLVKTELNSVAEVQHGLLEPLAKAALGGFIQVIQNIQLSVEMTAQIPSPLGVQPELGVGMYLGVRWY